MKSIKARLDNLEERLVDVLAEQWEDTVTFIYDDGTQKTMGYHAALTEVFNNHFCQPRIIESDEPPGSIIWAVITGSSQDDEPHAGRRINHKGEQNL